MKNAKIPALLKILVVVLFLSISFLSPQRIHAFGSNPDNYYCPQFNGISGTFDSTNFKCNYTNTDGSIFVRNALLKPPPLAIAQIWFVRILYVIWAVSGVVFTFILMAIGGRYMLSFGNEVALEKVIKGFQKWVLGLVLVFFSYPLLNTFFGLLPINQTSCYADIEMPGFQFFFPTACTPKSPSQYCQEDLGFTVGSPAFIACVRDRS